MSRTDACLSMALVLFDCIDEGAYFAAKKPLSPVDKLPSKEDSFDTPLLLAPYRAKSDWAA